MKWRNKGHEYDDIGGSLKDKKRIYMYGAGGVAREILNIIEGSRKWIPWEIVLVDRDVKKQDSGVWGYPVVSPQEFFRADKKEAFVVICPEGETGKEIYKLVQEADIDKRIIYQGAYFLYTYLPIYFAYIHNLVFFTSENILPSTVCNLNCRDCLNFTPYIRQHCIENIEELKRCIDVFFGAVDLIYRFQITGGEPLLYKHLAELIAYIDDNYRERIIRLEMVTNATIVPSDEICNVLKERNIYVFLDDYRQSLEKGEKLYKQVHDKLEQFHINYTDNYVSSWIRLYTPEDSSLLCNPENVQERFCVCGNPWSTLKDGKISSCNYAGYAHNAGLCEGQENEYYDLTLFTSDKRKELIEFRTGYSEKGYVNFALSAMDGHLFAKIGVNQQFRQRRSYMKWTNKGHEFEKIGEIFRKKSKLYIYGCGECGKYIFDNLEKYHIVSGFIDKSKQKQTEGFCGMKVHSPAEVLEDNEKKSLIIVDAFDEKIKKEMYQKLEEYGWIKNQDYFDYSDFTLTLNKPYFPLYMYYQYNKIYVSSGCFIPSNYCNLNCKECLNFTPYIKSPYMLSAEQVKKDVDLQFQVIDYFGRFQISGGEPLLYKDFTDIVNYIGGGRYRKQIGIFETVTNGTVVPNDEICKAIYQNDMTVYLDNYVAAIPEKLNKREEIIEKFEKYKIKWIDNTVEDWFSLDVFGTDNSSFNDAELCSYFDKCNNPWHYYKNGKIYLCNFAQFSVEAGINKEDNTAQFDITAVTDENRIELLEFLLNYSDKGYVELCKRCSGWEAMNPKRVSVAEQCKRMR